MTLIFCTLFFSKSRVLNFQKAGCPIFKNSGCKLTGRLYILRVVLYVHDTLTLFLQIDKLFIINLTLHYILSNAIRSGMGFYWMNRTFINTYIFDEIPSSLFSSKMVLKSFWPGCMYCNFFIW